MTAKPIRLDARSLELRRVLLGTLACAGRGHVGPSLSLMEILRVLYDGVLRFDPAQPRWPGRDRMILSKGHGCLALFVLLADKGFFPKSELERFCRFDGILGGHPDPKVPGVEAYTGSLGHGLPLGLGMALHARLAGLSQRVFVVMGDGECQEGSVWEAALHAAKHGLTNLCVVVDANSQQSYGPVEEVCPLESLAAKWEAFGFSVREVDGHDVPALESAFAALPFDSGRPSALICRTVKGCGIPPAENNPAWHHKSRLDDQQCASLAEAMEKCHA